MKDYINLLTSGRSLREEEMRQATFELLAEERKMTEIAAFLIALKTKRETPEELAGLAGALREAAVPLPVNGDFMDNCGTGGDGTHSFNVSTTAAFVLAGAGIGVAKHGNRSVSSRSGSADVLEALGVPLDLPATKLVEQLERDGLAFLFAQNLHPRTKRVQQVRRELGVPTIFNLVGPLTNPVAVRTQLLGVYREDMLEHMALALHRLGRERAVVLHGACGMDEASLAGENQLVLLEGDEMKRFSIRPEEVGLRSATLEAVKGGDAFENAKILLSVLQGERGPYRDTVLFNAGIGLFANGAVDTIAEGVELSAESIDTGSAMRKLEQLQNDSKEAAG